MTPTKPRLSEERLAHIRTATETYPLSSHQPLQARDVLALLDEVRESRAIPYLGPNAARWATDMRAELEAAQSQCASAERELLAQEDKCITQHMVVQIEQANTIAALREELKVLRGEHWQQFNKLCAANAELAVWQSIEAETLGYHGGRAPSDTAGCSLCRAKFALDALRQSRESTDAE